MQGLTRAVLLTALLLTALQVVTTQEPTPAPIALPLPPSPDPSNFTFTGLDAAPGSRDLQISFRLFGSGLLPYGNTTEAAIRQGLQQTLRGALGEDGFTTTAVSPVLQQPAQGNSLETLVVNVTLSTQPSSLQRMLDELQTTIQNAQLAGNIRVAGIYDLGRLSVDAYSILAGTGQAPNPSRASTPVKAPAPAPAVVQPPGIAPAPVPAPKAAKTPAPGVPAPAPAVPAPAPLPRASLAPTPAPRASADGVTPSGLTAPAPAPSLPSAQELTPSPEPVSPAPVPEPAAIAAPPAPAPMASTPAAKPAAQISPSPQLSPVNLTLQLQGAQGLNSSGVAALQAALANLTGQSASQVVVQNPLAPTVASGGRRLLGEPAEGMQGGGGGFRRVLRQASQVPVTINTANQQQVAEQLSSAASAGNLTALLRQAGLNVTNAQIISVNGQPVITADVPTPTGSQSVSLGPATGPAAAAIPISGGSRWDNKAVLWGVIGGTGGVIALVITATCLGARCVAARTKRHFPPADSKVKKEEVKAPSSPSSTDDLEGGFLGTSSRQGSLGSSTATPQRASRSNSGMAGLSHSHRERQEQEELMSTRELASYLGQFSYVVPSKAELEATSGIAEVPVESEEGQTSSGLAAQGPEAENDPAAANAAGTLGSGLSKEDVAISPTLAVMQVIAGGELFADRFFLEEGCIKGSKAIVVAAKDTKNGNQSCMCKFITSPVDFTREMQLHDMLPDDPSPIPGIVASYPLGSFPQSGLPAVLVTQGGDYSLSQWHTKLERAPDAYHKRAIFHMTCKALARLHRKRVVHGSLTPDNVLWFGGEDLVKLSSFSFWAFDGTNIPLHPALRYAPPETVLASAKGKDKMPSSFSMDCWSLGAIGFGILARAPIFGNSFSDADVIQSLLGNMPLPWELDGQMFQMIANTDARNLIKCLLRRDAGARWDIEQVLASPYFSGLPSLPYRLSLARNPSYPRQAVPRVTMNPLSSLRSREAAAAPTEQQNSTAAEAGAGDAPDGIANLLDTAESLSAAANVKTSPGPEVSPVRYENAAYGSSLPSTPGSIYGKAAEAEPRPARGLLMNNPAYSAEAGSLHVRSDSEVSTSAAPGNPLHSVDSIPEQAEWREPALPHTPLGLSPSRNLGPSRFGPPSGPSPTARGDAGRGAGRPSSAPGPSGAASHASLSSETLARLDSSNSKQKLLFSPTRGGVPPGSVQRRMNSFGGPSEGDANSTGGLLRTMSLVGGHSRAGSVAGWESLEGLENTLSEMTSEASNSLPFVLKSVPCSTLTAMKGSVVVMGICIEEVQSDATVQTPGRREVAEAVALGTATTVESPMVPSKQSTFTNHPVFMLRLGARFVFRIHLATGSRRGWVPLMLTGPIKMRIGFARSDEGDTLEVRETEAAMGKWVGFAIWDSGTPRVAQLAGKFGQQTRMVVTTDFQRKGSEDVVSIEHEIYSVMCPPGQRIPAASSWVPGEEMEAGIKALPWAKEAAKGAVTICKIVRQRPRSSGPF